MRPLAITSLLLLAACPSLEPIDPPPSLAPPSSAALVGTYQVASSFTVPATVAAPGPLGDALGLLHGLAENPAGALLDLADAAGAPAIAELRLVLPDSLEADLEGWMNGYLDPASVDGESPHARIVALDEQVRSVLLAWELRSTLSLPEGAAGTHSPIALVFSRASEPIVVPVDDTAPVTAAAGVVATVTWPEGGGSPVASIGRHSMGIPFGHYALQGLGALLARQYGAASVGEVLAGMVGCDALAASVAAQCVDVAFARVCVGNESLLKASCEAGVAEAAARLEARILAIDYEAIRFVSGAATVEGVALDAGTATAAALVAGSWDSTIDLGQEPEAATATFSAAWSQP